MIDEDDILANTLLSKARSRMMTGFRMPERDRMQLLALLAALSCLRIRFPEPDDEGMPEWILDKLMRLFRHPVPDPDEAQVLLQRILVDLGGFINAEGSAKFAPFPGGAIAIALELIGSIGSPDAAETGTRCLGVYDALYRRYVGMENELEYYNSDKFARLAAALSDSPRSPWEYFMGLGDFSFAPGRANRPAYATELPIHEYLLRLRFCLHGMQLWLTQGQVPADAFALISHPQQALTNASLFTVDMMRASSALSALFSLWRRDGGIGNGIAIIPGVDRTITGKRGAFRSRLAASGHLTAIVDLPLSTGPNRLLSSNSRDTTVSAWIFSERPLSTQRILCIDASKLPKREFSLDRSAQDKAEMEFIGAIVKLCTDRFGSRRSPPRLESRHPFAARLNREFKQGYVDVPGLCRVVSWAELEQRKFSLRASTYVQAQAQAEQEWLPTIDSTPILERLSKHPSEKFRAYIIGNNGTGKSLLLRELANHLKQLGVRTVGIAFSSTDRFPYAHRVSANASFVYRGARTGKAVMHYATASSQLAALTKLVHVDQARLDVFNETMEMLGFERRHYLVPLDVTPVNGEYTDAQLEDFVLLTDRAEDNERLLAHSGNTQHQLALMRQADARYVAVFDTLSSGERQVLTLVIKLIADAQPGSVMLIDEPEISLHVTWQRLLPQVLAGIGTRLDCSMVIATHSPVIMASASVQGDPGFVAKEGMLTAVQAKPSQSVETVLFDDFETYTENNRRVHERCARIVSDVIALINNDDGGHHEEIDGLRAELRQMSAIIDKSPYSWNGPQRDADRDLIRKAYIAIEEILTNKPAASQRL